MRSTAWRSSDRSGARQPLAPSPKAAVANGLERSGPQNVTFPRPLQFPPPLFPRNSLLLPVYLGHHRMPLGEGLSGKGTGFSNRPSSTQPFIIDAPLPVRDFLVDADANPGKYTKREVRPPGLEPVRGGYVPPSPWRLVGASAFGRIGGIGTRIFLKAPVHPPRSGLAQQPFFKPQGSRSTSIGGEYFEKVRSGEGDPAVCFFSQSSCGCLGLHPFPRVGGGRR